MKSIITTFLILITMSVFGQDYSGQHFLLVGVEHSDPVYQNGRIVENAHLFNACSREMFCAQFPEILKIANGRSILLVVEGTTSGFAHFIDTVVKYKAKLPVCLPNGTCIVGADDRTDKQRHKTDTCFEENLICKANYFYSKGYFPIVVAGASHIAALTNKNKYMYTYCVSPELKAKAQKIATIR